MEGVLIISGDGEGAVHAMARAFIPSTLKVLGTPTSLALNCPVCIWWPTVAAEGEVMQIPPSLCAYIYINDMRTHQERGCGTMPWSSHTNPCGASAVE